MPNIRWTPELLSQPTAAIIAHFARQRPPRKVSRQQIAQARKARGIANPDGHGGPGRGGGRPPLIDKSRRKT